MDTIEEHQSKCEMMSVSPSPENVRICLVGDVLEDQATVVAAQSFGVPIITSETGLDIINDSDWRTHFILNTFEGPTYEAIHKSKQSILGPPALQQIANMKESLKCNARPVYNFAMRGVVTCFTGIRKKDELTKLVTLIHSMGGCIRKDMNSKITHLISIHSGGEKYQYAKTFRLTVVRPAWVYAAWQRRDDLQFCATEEEFSKEHKLKAFEGQKICFFGFPADERQHMVDVLLSNGGVPADLDDPDCSHVVMPNSGGYFPDTLSDNSPNSPAPTSTHTPTSSSNTHLPNTDMQVDEVSEDVEKPARQEGKKLSAVEEAENDEEDDDDDFDAGMFAVDPRKNPEQYIEEGVTPFSDELGAEELTDSQLKKNGSTPKSFKMLRKSFKKFQQNELTPPPEGENEISPIVSGATQINEAEITAMDTDDHHADGHPNELTTCEDQFMPDGQNEFKRKRENFDTISLMSTESFALPNSTKKPKLSRTHSITRSLRRSMSFVAERTPIAKMLRPRRSSVALDAAPPQGSFDLDSSICSHISVDSSVFNESTNKPMKDKLRGFLRDRLTRSSKKEKNLPNVLKTPDKKHDQLMNQTNDDGFKTPKAPMKHSAAFVASKNTATTSHSFAPSSPSTRELAHLKTSATSRDFSPSIRNPGAGIPSTNLFLSNTNAPSSVTDISTASASTPISLNCSQNQNQLSRSAVSNAANPVQYEDSTLTVDFSSLNPQKEGQNEAGCAHPHTVVDEHSTLAKPEPRNNRTHILKSDWFWYTIQNGYADEMDYLFGDYLDSIANTPNTDRRDSLPISFNRRKRRRFSQRIQLEGTPIDSNKRRSSVSDAGLLSVSGSFFDCTTSPDKPESAGKLLNKSSASTSEPTPVKSKSMRFNHFMDFFSTESNYVGILDTIVNLFKNPLEEIAETNDALLNKSEIKAIFSNFLPIHEVHQHMLERLRTLQSKWQEDCLIGEIILQHRDDLMKAYPPYVNFFEQMKDTLQHCDSQNPRFHAFLKINQTKPECGRQTLQDLMIRPVQRLPSISLLLNDILKHTSKNNPDFVKLEEALKAIKEVMAHINEDKRKTESRMAIFDIFNDIEGCPAHLVSSNRNFISKCEVTELSENLSGRGDSLVLYLFSDTIEVCKKRSRGLTSTKSPSATKSYKHIKLMSLNAIRFVIDITDSPRAFALLYRQDKEKLHSFTICDEEIDKVIYLKELCKQMAENACRTDTDKALLCRTSQELDVDISDVNLSTLSKAFKLARRTRMQVGRAFSFNKTPSRLKRAVSTMMTSPFGSTNSLTPATQLAQMRLASCNNIHEVADEQGSRSSSPSSQSEALVAPLSVQPMRKNKPSVLNVGRI